MVEKLVTVARRVSDFLTEHRVPHAVAGGLAVRAHGYKRSTTDVDIYVEDVPRSALRSFAPTARWYVRPMAVEGAGFVLDSVRVELFVRPLSWDMRHLTEDDLVKPLVVDGIRTLTPEALVTSKMCAGRDKDTIDIVELLKRGVVSVDEVSKRFVARPWLKTLMWRVTLLDRGRWRGRWRDRCLVCSVCRQGSIQRGEGANRWGVPASQSGALLFSCGHTVSESRDGTPV